MAHMISQKPLQKIAKLHPHLINQIAAGEVIERPAAILKELIENALDAGATRIDIAVEDGGRAMLSVRDNGHGIPQEDIVLAFERHATSKLAHEDLFAVNTFGFRGEALPSIASISRTQMITRTKDDEHAWTIRIEGGNTSEIIPHSATVGTMVEVRDVFYATPARLKFLKNTSTELGHCREMVSRIAMANPSVYFTFRADGKLIYDWPGSDLATRISQVMGKEFSQNTIPVLLERNGYRLEGLVSLPTYSRSQANDQYIYVNNRWVRDRNVAGILRVAYQDVLMTGRHPMAVLFLNLDSYEVDVNVHPAKTEVRFRDSQFVRSFLIQGIKQSLTASQHTPSNSIGQLAAQAFNTSASKISITPSFDYKSSYKPILRDSYPSAKPQPLATFASTVEDERQTDYPMGLAKAQLFETFIVAQTDDALLIIDQHAAHERIVYEELKAEWNAKGQLPSQSLMQPEYIELKEEDCELFKQHQHLFQKIGFVIDIFGDKTLVVHSTPIACHLEGSKEFIYDVLADIKALGEGVRAEEVLWEKLSSRACNNSIRAGKTLSLAEMNAMLRQMEFTPKSAQCNHGRPTFIKLDRKALENLFER